MEFHQDVTERIDFCNFFDDCTEGADFLTMDPSVSKDPSLGDPFWKPPSSSDSSWINEIENMLVQEDGNGAIADSAKELCDAFLADVFVDCGEEGSGEIVDSPRDLVLSATEDDKCPDSNKEKVDGADANDDERERADANDPISKKRRRQERNRDAASKSRERKRSYVKDLEMKSRYLEGECRRLGRLLQCCYAENQALRYNLHMGFGSVASISKQESAVLLLESLLLGSLLWFMGAMCLFTLLKFPHPIPEPVGVERVEGGQEKPGPREWLSKSQDPAFGRSRRCRSARIKMKACVLITW